MSIEFKIVDEYPKEIQRELMKRNLEDAQIFFHPDSYLGAGDKGHKRESKKVKVAAYAGDRLIGISYGSAVNKNRFMMEVSLVEKEFRGQGIYSKMLELVLSNTREFDEIDSCHHQFNSRIIAKKLKHNFYIIGLEIGPAVGPILRMRYFNNQKLLSIMKFRMGLIEKSEVDS
ncbi:MAG: hypothetical protein CME71_01935 [Halobacteriovorax sp.]|nr:hypothetical protein [Halobacteriovorax sp.]